MTGAACRRAPLLAIVAAAAVAAGAGCGGDDDSTSDQGPDITGEWQGRLEQRDLKPFEVRATISSLTVGERSGTVRYSGIDCSGHWTLLSRGAGEYRFREVIDRGHGGDCKGVGTVRVAPDGADLDYVFRGGGVTSRGVLSRTG